MRKIVLLLTLLCFTATPKFIRSYSPGTFQSSDTLEQRLDILARKISDNLTENQKRTIAVVEFSDLKGNVTNFGRFLSEELITRLYQTKKFKVIERQQLNKIIAEQKLTLTGVIDPASAQKLGRVLGVDSIVFGSVSDLVKTLRINARLIGTETGEVFAAASVEIVKDEAVSSLMADGGATSNASPIRTLPAAPDDSSRAKKKVVADDFTFELNACRRTGQSVTCDFTVVNNSSEDQLFYLYGDNYHKSPNSSRLIDSAGNESYPSETRLGSAKGDSRTLFLRLSLVPQVSIRASLRFEGVNADAASIKLLRITFNREGKRRSMRVPQVDYADFMSVAIE